MEIKPVAYFRSPVKEKFGLPRQAGLAPDLIGHIIMEPEFNAPEALRGLEGFGYLWLLWGFNLNRTASHGVTVRPPRLGGNERIGVFASRSPFRPNPIGLSSVKIEGIKDGIITVSGADLADGSPIYDIKPYIPYTDSHPDAKDGFVHERAWNPLEVTFRRILRVGGFPCRISKLSGKFWSRIQDRSITKIPTESTACLLPGTTSASLSRKAHSTSFRNNGSWCHHVGLLQIKGAVDNGHRPPRR